jgi:hypothetical protein
MCTQTAPYNNNPEADRVNLLDIWEEGQIFPFRYDRLVRQAENVVGRWPRESCCMSSLVVSRIIPSESEVQRTISIRGITGMESTLFNQLVFTARTQLNTIQEELI